MSAAEPLCCSCARNLTSSGQMVGVALLGGLCCRRNGENCDLRRSAGLVQRERRHAFELTRRDHGDGARTQCAVLGEVARGDGISESGGAAEENFGVTFTRAYASLM